MEIVNSKTKYDRGTEGISINSFQFSQRLPPLPHYNYLQPIVNNGLTPVYLMQCHSLKT